MQLSPAAVPIASNVEDDEDEEDDITGEKSQYRLSEFRPNSQRSQFNSSQVLLRKTDPREPASHTPAPQVIRSDAREPVSYTIIAFRFTGRTATNVDIRPGEGFRKHVHIIHQNGRGSISGIGMVQPAAISSRSEQGEIH